MKTIKSIYLAIFTPSIKRVDQALENYIVFIDSLKGKPDGFTAPDITVINQ